MTLHTGKHDGAGTSAHVAITAHGEQHSSGPHPLEGPPGSDKPLQPGQVSRHETDCRLIQMSSSRSCLTALHVSCSCSCQLEPSAG